MKVILKLSHKEMFPRSDISEQNAPVSNPVFDEKKPKNGNHGYVLWTITS